MAVINSSDIGFSIIPETTLGTTPTTGARYELPTIAGQSVPTYNANDIASETMRPNRSANGQRRGNGSGEGQFDFRLQRCDAIDFLMTSALSGTWQEIGTAPNEVETLKAGKVDSSFTTVSELASNMYELAKGGVVSSMSVSGTAAAGVSTSFGMVFIEKTTANTNNPITKTAVTDAMEFTGADVGAITVGGQTLQYTEFSLEVTQDRNMRDILSSTVPAGVGTSGNRGVRLTLKAYRESFAIDTAITGAAQPVTFEIKYAGKGYKFVIPAAYGSVPYNETADDLLVVLEFVAGYDATTGTDFYIEKIG